jgi:hypothetical protein
MNEETPEIQEETVNIDDSVLDATDTSIVDEAIEADDISPVDALINERMGNIELTISPADLKYIKNLINNKVEWKGPNEAYLVILAIISINSELKDRNTSSTERVTVSLPASVIESINFLLTKVTGKGEESAHRIFAISMILRPAIEKMKELDQRIESLKSEKN